MSKKEELKKMGKKHEIEIVAEEIQETIDFDKAIKYFKKEYPEKALYITDKEALKMFVVKFIPNLCATKKEFFNVIGKY